MHNPISISAALRRILVASLNFGPLLLSFALGQLCVPNLWAQELQLVPQALDLGTLKVGTLHTGQIEVHNPGNDVVEINLSIDNPHFSVKPTTLVLNPAGRAALSIEFGADTSGTYQAELLLQTPKLFGKKTVPIPLSAQAMRPSLELEPIGKPLDFGTLALGKSAQRTAVLINASPVSLIVDSLSLARGQAFALTQRQYNTTIAPQSRLEVSLSFRPDTGGPNQDQLIVHSTDLDPPQHMLVLQGEGLAPKAVFSPLPAVGMAFDQVKVGQSAIRLLTIINKGRANLQLDSLKSEGGGFSVNWDGPDVSITPGQRLQIPIHFQPTLVGPATSNLVIQCNDPQNPRTLIPLSGEGRLVPAQIQVVNQTTINFGSVSLGHYARDYLLLWNKGDQPYTAALDLSGDQTDDFSLGDIAVLLQPGVPHKVELRFSPKEVGQRQVDLIVATPTGPQTLHLVGTGKFLRLGPSAVEFDRVAVRQNSSRLIEVTNLGNTDFTVNRIVSTHPDFTVQTQINSDNSALLAANGLTPLPLNLVFTPSKRGPLAGVLRFEGYWDEGTVSRDILLQGTGVAADIRLHPSNTLDFGYVVLGNRTVQTLVATNAGDTALAVQASALNPEVDIQPEAFTLEAGASTPLQIGFRPQALGLRNGQILLANNAVNEEALTVQITGKGALKDIDLNAVTALVTSRKSRIDTLEVPWSNIPLMLKEGTKIDLFFDVGDSLSKALVGRQLAVEWTPLDANYDPKGSGGSTTITVYEASEHGLLAEDLNLRLDEAKNKRVRLKITTHSYPGAPPQTLVQTFETGGWIWEFEAKPLVSFLTIRPGRTYTDDQGNRIKGKTERLIGLPGLAFAGWHNSESAFVSGIHLTAIGNVLEALSTSNSIAVSMGVAVSFYRDKFLLGFGRDIYDHRPKAKQRGTSDYIMTVKFSGIF